MTFADNVAKASSERYALVRLSPRRNISDLVVEGVSNYWSYSFDGNPFRVSFNNGTETEYTEDTTLSGLQTWYYDEDAKVLHVRTSENNPASSSYLYMEYYLTYTNTQDRVMQLDPTGSGDEVMWEDRIKKTPRITQDISNIMDGVITVSSTPLTLENSDKILNEHFSLYDTYLNTDIILWFSVDSEVQRLFTGTIRTLDITSTTISLGMVDSLTKLDTPAYMGSTVDEATYKDPDYTVHGKDYGKPIPMVIGETITQLTDSSVIRAESTGGTFQFKCRSLDTSGMPQARCTSYNSVTATTNNRTWGLCRTPLQFATTTSFGTIATGSWNVKTYGSASRTTTYQDTAVGEILVTTNSDHTCIPGDTGVATLSGNSITFIVIEVTTSTYRIACINMIGGAIPAGDTDDTSNLTMPASATSASIFIRHSDGTMTIPILGSSGTTDVDCYLDYTTLTNGNHLVEIIFKNNFEHRTNGYSGASVHPNASILTPESAEIFFRFKASRTGSVSLSHGELVDKVLDGEGFTVDASSISTANSELSNTICIMTVPDSKATEHTTTRKVLSEILQSSMGYVRLDGDDTIHYELFDVAGTATKIRSDDDVLSSTLVPRVSYYDMYKEIIVNNRHHQADNETADGVINEVVECLEATRVHGATRVKKLNNVFTELSTDNKARFRRLLGNPRVSYSYAVASVDLDLQVGESVELTTSNLLGDVSSVTIVVTKIIKSLDSVKVSGLHLRDSY